MVEPGLAGLEAVKLFHLRGGEIVQQPHALIGLGRRVEEKVRRDNASEPQSHAEPL